MKHYESDQIRSIVLAGHGGAGKTSIGDALARTTGLNNRLGSVSDGSSMLDYEPEEKDRGGSLACSFLSCEYDDYKVHVVDTPGDGDFIHDAHLAMQAVDACVLVVSAVGGAAFDVLGNWWFRHLLVTLARREGLLGDPGTCT